MSSDNLLPLAYLKSGDGADVACVCGESGLVQRLAELGVHTGCRLKMLQPGTPCLLEIGGLRLSLRGDAATQILVRLLPSSLLTA
jgi:ferrous iron transport protein A